MNYMDVHIYNGVLLVCNEDFNRTNSKNGTFNELFQKICPQIFSEPLVRLDLF